MSEGTNNNGNELTRRRMLQGAAVALTAAAGTAVLGPTGSGGVPAQAADPEAGDSFDEVFRGRRIQGMPMNRVNSGHQHGGSGYMVLVDGKELHVMRNADGTWIPEWGLVEPLLPGPGTGCPRLDNRTVLTQ